VIQQQLLGIRSRRSWRRFGACGVGAPCPVHAQVAGTVSQLALGRQLLTMSDRDTVAARARVCWLGRVLLGAPRVCVCGKSEN